MITAKLGSLKALVGMKSQQVGLSFLNLVNDRAIRATIAWNVRELYRSGLMDQSGK